jgi:hypothetical protein
LGSGQSRRCSSLSRTLLFASPTMRPGQPAPV